MSKFISLHNHTEVGSPLDGMNDVNELFIRAKEIGHPGIAITDHGTMTALYDSYKASMQTGVKLIPGMEAYFSDDLSEKKSYHLVLLAQNEVGYRNLLKLNYLAYKNQVSGYMGKKTPRISWEHISEINEGLIALTACSNGLIGKTLITNRDEAGAIAYLKKFKQAFGDRLFLELQPHALAVTQKDGKEVNQVKLNEGLLKLSTDLDIPYVITCDAHYKDSEHAKYHDFMLAIKDKKPINDPDRFRYGTQDMYLKTDEELINFFGSAVANKGMAATLKIMESCEVPHYIAPKGAILPKYPVPKSDDYDEFLEWRATQRSSSKLTEDKLYLRFKCVKGMEEKTADFDDEKKTEYWDRIKSELTIIEGKDFSSYMLIVADYINWAKKSMPVGSGRGSAAGSLISYFIGITDVDPIKYDLLFERFQNAEKKSFPDIDTDFANPPLVKEYIKEKYGEDNVSMISNWGTLAPKVIVKDVARSLTIGGDKSSAFKIANSITAIMPDVDYIDDAMKSSKEFSTYMKKYPELYEYSNKLQNLTRNWSIHAAGIVIGDRPLYEIAPLRIDEKLGNVVTQWEKNRCEDNGLIKMDILGLETLNVIDNAFKIIKERRGLDIKISDIQLDDQDVYQMIGKGETAGVFQLESSLTPLCMKLKPTDIEGISAINAIGRPSCLPEERKTYINRALGLEEVVYDHPTLERALKKTYGVIVYEEQAMTIAKDCAGWNLSQADSLRKISKLKGKDPALVDKTEKAFIADCQKFSKMPERMAKYIWEKYILVLSGYAFNKSHSISYSYISYYTAWLKCKYPVEFMCSLINSEDPNSDKVQEYIDECRKMGIKLLSPDINKSHSLNRVISDNEIVTGLGSIKGIGAKALAIIMKNAPYVNIYDFLARTPSRLVRKTVIQSFAKAGVFDSFDITRKDVFDNYKKYRDAATAALKKESIVLFKTKKDKGEDTDDDDDIKDSKKVFSEEDIEDDNEHSGEDLVQNLEEIDEFFIDADLTERIKNLTKKIIYVKGQEWDRKTLLISEREVLGRTISGSLHEAFTGFFTGGYQVTPLSRVSKLDNDERIKIEGIVKNKIKEFSIKNGKNIGKKFAKYLVEDVHGNTAGLTFWADDYERYRSHMTDGIPFKAICKINEYMGQKDLVLITLERVYGKTI